MGDDFRKKRRWKTKEKINLYMKKESYMIQKEILLILLLMKEL